MATLRERQLDEMDAIEAVFGAEFQCDDLDTAVQMRRHIQGCSELRNAACLAFTVWLTPEREVGCRVSLPPGYPETAKVEVSVAHGTTGPGLTNAEVAMLTVAMVSKRDAAPGDEEVVFDVVTAAQAVHSALLVARDQATAVTASVAAAAAAAAVGPGQVARPCIARRLVWFHHIKNPNKKKDIVHWGSELHLRGYCKPGYPGVLIVEGLRTDVDEIVRRLRQLTWKAMVVKADAGEPIPDGVDHTTLLRFPDKVTMLDEGDMSKLSQFTKDAGLHELFLALIH